MSGDDNENALANDDLIASAPEMLEALKDCVAALESLMRHDRITDHIFRGSATEKRRSAKAILAAADEAIAKAEGRS